MYYDVYDIDIFDSLLLDIANYSDQGIVVLAGDLNSRVGESSDFVENDSLPEGIYNNVSDVVTYINDIALPIRKSEDKICNTFGRKLIDLCKSSGMRMCNGRGSDNNGRLTFLIILGQVL